MNYIYHKSMINLHLLYLQTVRHMTTTHLTINTFITSSDSLMFDSKLLLSFRRFCSSADFNKESTSFKTLLTDCFCWTTGLEIFFNIFARLILSEVLTTDIFRGGSIFCFLF